MSLWEHPSLFPPAGQQGAWAAEGTGLMSLTGAWTSSEGSSGEPQQF